MRLRLSIVCLVAAVFARASVMASGYQSKTWRTDNGLPATTVTAIQQTSDGYLWIGTPVGLARFDGVRFVHFTATTVSALDASGVARMFEDRAGTFWIAMESGRVIAWRDGAARIHIPGTGAAGNAVVAFADDAAGGAFVQTADGRFGRLTATGVEFLATTGPLGRRTRLGLVADESGALWVGTKDGIRLWENAQLIAPVALSAMNGLPVDAMAPAQGGGFWAYADHRLWRIRDRMIAQEHKGPARFPGSAVALVEAFGDRPWVAAEGGRLFYLDASDTWQVVGSESGLRSTNLTLYKDREGNLWRGSAGGGLTRVRPNIFKLHELPPESPDRNAVSVSADPIGNVWAMLNTRMLASISADTHELRILGTRQDTRTVRSLFCDRSGNVWCGSPGNLISRFKDDAFVPAFNVDREARGVNAFFESATGDLWIGYSGGAGAVVMPGGDPRRRQRVQGLPFPNVCAISQGADGAMWFGTSGGGAFRLEHGRWERFAASDGLASDVVRCFHMDPDGTVWMGTLNGVARWRHGRISNITTQQGLWHDTVSHIADDQRGHFWMSSPGGIFHTTRQELHGCADGVRNWIRCVGYNRDDGMPAQECAGGAQPAGARTPDGRLWFPTADGLVSLDPRSVVDNDVPPPVRVEEIGLGGSWQTLSQRHSEISVAPGNNRVAFRFTALSLTSPEKVRFRYRLDGIDRDWSAPTEQRNIVYPFVAPGRYRFRVMASNNAGLWSTSDAAIDFVVHPFLWQTKGFWITIACAVAIGVAWAVRQAERRRARLALERMERAHAVERERSRIAQDIHDDIGASLTQIAFLSDRVDGARHDPAEVGQWNRRIAQTAHSTIRSLDEIVWAVSPKHDTLESLANYLGRFAQEHLELAGVGCRLEIPTVLPSLPLNAEVRHNLLLATRETLQNIVTHAAATQATVTLELGDEQLRICIADNGQGSVTESPPVRGNGLANIQLRMQEIHGRASIISTPGGGMTVELSVPRIRLFAERARPSHNSTNDSVAP